MKNQTEEVPIIYMFLSVNYRMKLYKYFNLLIDLYSEVSNKRTVHAYLISEKIPPCQIGSLTLTLFVVFSLN